MEHPQSVIHILCTRESMNFRFQNINYNIVAGDYVILANMSLASGFSNLMTTTPSRWDCPNSS